MIRTGLLFFAILIALVMSEGVRAQSKKSSQEFQRQREQLRNRYRDYLKHFDKKKIEQTRRQAGKEKYRKQRQKEFERWDRARRNYNPKKGKTFDSEQLFQKWEKKQAKIAELEKVKRARYIKNRDALKRIEESSDRVPQEAEVGLIGPDEL